jgi:Zn-dependent protease with chaperone function
MGPFLSAIVAAILGTLALDTIPKPEEVERGPATLFAIGIIAFAWITARVRQAGPGERMRPIAWARPLDLLLFAWLLFGTDWTTVAREAVLDMPFLRHLLVLSPYFLASLARVEAAWPAERAEGTEQTGAHGWTRGRAVGFHAKLLLIPILPLLLITGIHDTARLVPEVRIVLDSYPAIDYAAMAATFTLVLLATPRILKALFGTRPVGGPLRELLDAHLTQERVRVGGIERVDTGGLIPNAAWLGLTLRGGRIFITDALLETLPPQEVRAVFAHEVAHGTRRHLLWFLAYFLAIMLGPYVAGSLIGSSLWVAGGLGIAWTIAGLIGFVAISRRFEVEADLVAADSLGDAELFGHALARVGVIAGKPLDRHGVRHFSIASRIGIVRASAANPEVRSSWNGRIRACKLVIAGFALLVAMAAAWKVPEDLEIGAAIKDLREAETVKEESELRRRDGGALPAADAARADAELRAKLESIVARTRPALAHPAVRDEAARIGIAAQMSLADEALRTGNFDEARAIAADVESNWPKGDPIGDLNRLLLDAQLAALDPSRDLASVRPKVKAAIDATEEIVRKYGRNQSSDWVQQEFRFLAAATGLEGASFDYEGDSFESARLLALARGARLGGAESREASRALDAWPTDFAWRREVLKRALGDRQPADALKDLVAAETRRSHR